MSFRHVFVYALGKADWMAYGLPVERGPDAPPMVIDFMVRDVPRCHPENPVGAARDAAYEMGIDVCPVVNEEDVLLGLCTRNSLHAHPSIAVELVMEPGPVTVRPGMPIEEALRILERKKSRPLLVTTPDGKLIGCLPRSAVGESDGKAAAI